MIKRAEERGEQRARGGGVRSRRESAEIDDHRRAFAAGMAAVLAEGETATYRRSDGRWTAGSGATWSLRSNRLRPQGWTSADAAGLPILPGLLRYDEVRAGRVDHAIRFTTDVTDRRHVWPARHDAGSTSLPCM